MRVCTSVCESDCTSDEPTWLQAVQRKPGGWLVVVILSTYIAADKANFRGWHSLTWPSIQASQVAPEADEKGKWQSTARAEQAWQHADNTPLHVRQLEIVQEDTAGSSLATNETAASSTEYERKPHDALLFIVVAMIIGTAITFLASFPLFHGVQQSVALFVIGGLLAIILERSLGSHEDEGVIGSSFNMWMEIDPHLILFTLLPALLTGDAMTLDTQVARRVASQCVYLASGGVLCNTLLAALFLYVYLPYDWTFLQCMTIGAILCATDPVAVVALLKELGASPTLTVQIQGESLLNDGTAMVLYAISYSMLQGKKYDASEIMIYLLQKVALAVVIGAAVGYVFVLWIRSMNQLRNRNASMIQISLTICCAYWSFIISEGVLKINGVLATVFAALVLAHQMWPAIIHKESMHTVWHTLEYIGNTLIFFLAGALTGKSSMYVSWVDYLHVLVIWLTLMIIRGLVLYLSRPVLKILNEEKQSVTPAEAIVITWGGLRGALGLALAIQVSIDRGGGAISQQDASRALFYVGGVAALTLVINATTCPMIVKKLGITRLEEEKRRMLLLMHRRLIELSATKSNASSVNRAVEWMLISTFQSINKDRRRRALHSAIGNIRKTGGQTVELMKGLSRRSTRRLSGGTMTPAASIGLQRVTERTDARSSCNTSISRDSEAGANSPLENVASPRSSASLSHVDRETAWAEQGSEKTADADAVDPERKYCEDVQKRCLASVVTEMPKDKDEKSCCDLGALLDYVKVEEPNMQPMSDLLDEYAEVKMKFNMIPKQSLKLIGDLAMPVMDMDQDHPLVHMLNNSSVNEALLRALNEGFFACLRSTYYKLMEAGDLRPGSNEADVLLNSISLALHTSYKDLLDFSFVYPFIIKKYHVLQDCSSVEDLSSVEAMQSILPEWSKKPQKAQKTRLHLLVESMRFHILMISAIVINAVFMIIEEEYRNSKNDSNPGWLIAEIAFCVIFFVECALKIADQHAKYFLDLWNCFDLLLVILGIAGLVFNIVALNLPVDSAQGRIVRVARVFRVMRLVRLFRLVRLMQGLTAILLRQQGALEVQEHIKKIQILTFFVKGHCLAQNEYVEYFGLRGAVDTVEVARVILQSQVSVYKAVSMAIGEEHLLNDVLLEQVNAVRESKVLAEELERFVMDAYKGGVVSHREADALLEPVRNHMKECYEEIRSPVFILTRQAKKRGRRLVESVLSHGRFSQGRVSRLSHNFQGTPSSRSLGSSAGVESTVGPLIGSTSSINSSPFKPSVSYDRHHLAPIEKQPSNRSMQGSMRASSSSSHAQGLDHTSLMVGHVTSVKE